LAFQHFCYYGTTLLDYLHDPMGHRAVEGLIDCEYVDRLEQLAAGTLKTGEDR
jgi:hypothetical protein